MTRSQLPLPIGNGIQPEVTWVLPGADSLFWLQIANDVVSWFDSFVTTHPILIGLTSVLVAGVVFAGIPRLERRSTLFLAGLAIFFLLVGGSDGILSYLVQQEVLDESRVVGANGGLSPKVQVPVMVVLFVLLAGASYLLDTHYRGQRRALGEE